MGGGLQRHLRRGHWPIAIRLLLPGLHTDRDADSLLGERIAGFGDGGGGPRADCISADGVGCWSGERLPFARHAQTPTYLTKGERARGTHATTTVCEMHYHVAANRCSGGVGVRAHGWQNFRSCTKRKF